MAIRVRPEILVAHLDGESVLLDLETKNYFRLNMTASAVWKGLEAGKGRADLIDALQTQFVVELEDATQGVDAIIDELSRRNLLQITSD